MSTGSPLFGIQMCIRDRYHFPETDIQPLLYVKFLHQHVCRPIDQVVLVIRQIRQVRSKPYPRPAALGHIQLDVYKRQAEEIPQTARKTANTPIKAMIRRMIITFRRLLLRSSCLRRMPARRRRSSSDSLLSVILFSFVCSNYQKQTSSRKSGDAAGRFIITQPVSYTHLDVYKRQISRCTEPPAGSTLSPAAS